MNVTVDQRAVKWLQAQDITEREAFNLKCQQAVADDLTTWRNVGKGLYDYRISGNFRMVARKSGGKDVKPSDSFAVLAIYRHGTSGGKQWVAGDKVPAYG